MARILIVDDEALMRDMAAESLRRRGHETVLAKNVPEGLEKFDASIALVLSDYKMPGMTGMDLLKKIREKDPEVPFVIMTAHGTVQVAVEAMRHSAWDFLEKPFDPDVLEITVDRALEVRHLRQENLRLREALDERFRIVGASGVLRSVQALITQVAPTRTTVLIQGESGTGKELVARAIHDSSPRADRPFVKVNCAALPESLFESELFGHEKGAFTGALKSQRGKFEIADSGTLLLDEISEMPLPMQAKLLRVLQEREIPKIGSESEIPVDVRIICSTNRDLAHEVEAGKFRADLFYRLNVIAIHVPALRERKEDIPELARWFLQRYNRENGFSVEGFSESALDRLRTHSWPGNIRELENAVQRAVVLTQSGTIQVASLGLDPQSRPTAQQAPSAAPPPTAPELDPSQSITIGEMERRMIFASLERLGGNRTRAAEQLGISIRTLRNKLREYRGEPLGEDDDES
ncbi:MAG TPA: sigma-54 dependent transcriptional regulator [Fibrobacteria bacterium]|nr:sigma-54 dependent transcriptional regulator [Fibrobacteria bacterium]HOX50186.1 sigma-54 dependent transcriptional regulator [Fibrobacteria bacterium]